VNDSSPHEIHASAIKQMFHSMTVLVFQQQCWLKRQQCANSLELLHRWRILVLVFHTVQKIEENGPNPPLGKKWEGQMIFSVDVPHCKMNSLGCTIDLG
jgi:hypothetical protein